MKRLLLIPLLALAALTGCDKIDVAPGAPSCLEDKIKSHQKRAACSTGNKVDEFKFQDKTVYVISDGTCASDGAAEVIDADCNHLGYLGGLAGNQQTEIKGVNFSANAIFVRNIWKK